MALTPGTRLGIYDIVAPIGEGGMGQVYRARDTKLNRDVALKILPDAFASDPDRLARFTREAQTLASLNHSNIAHIHGLEESGGVRALVMELVDGEDLSQRIARGAIPIGDALPLAKQIADALEAAHEQGVVHRDLKPANIKVRADGTVKVLDFGLAKAMDPESGRSGGPGGFDSPTLTSPAMMTGVGIILGTAAYMAPEQAKGRAVDKRADIWAFGVVLFEMLTGTRPFDGDGISETMARVIEREPDWNRLPVTVSQTLRAHLRRCLEKDPRQRIRDIGDMRLALDGAFDTGAPPLAASPSPKRAGGVAWSVAAAALLAAAALAVPAMRNLREAPPPETRVDIVTPATDDPSSFALSPDGRQIVFAASSAGGSRLWLRSLALATAQPLPGTEGGTFPFWSPDGRSIGFFANNALKRLDLGGASPQSLAPAGPGQGGTWNADGVIVFAPSLISALRRVSANGGASAALTTRAPQQMSHRWPQFLPDGKRFIFFVQGAKDTAGIYLGSLDGKAPTRLTPSDGGGAFMSSGWLLWPRKGTLVAQRLDTDKAVLTGEAVTVADGVSTDGFSFRSALSVAAAPVVAYRLGAGSRRQLTWFDRSGKATGTLGEPDGSLDNPRVSADGRRVAVSRTVQGNTDIWLLDSERATRFTFDESEDWFPAWSPDGARLAFQSGERGARGIFVKPTSGADAQEPLNASTRMNGEPNSWSSDGRFLFYQGVGLWIAPMTGERTPSLFLKNGFGQYWSVFSPDGRWVAYQSNESGRYEVYVRPFTPPGQPAPGAAAAQWQVSTTGGITPVWAPNGKELYYLNPAGAMMAAPIRVAGSTLEPGAPAMLFPTRIVGGGVYAEQGRMYDVTRDGRFLITTVLEDAGTPITLLTNWHPETKK